jgi:hypothetical protein
MPAHKRSPKSGSVERLHRNWCRLQFEVLEDRTVPAPLAPLPDSDPAAVKLVAHSVPFVDSVNQELQNVIKSITDSVPSFNGEPVFNVQNLPIIGDALHRIQGVSDLITGAEKKLAGVLTDAQNGLFSSDDPLQIRINNEPANSGLPASDVKITFSLRKTFDISHSLDLGLGDILKLTTTGQPSVTVQFGYDVKLDYDTTANNLTAAGRIKQSLSDLLPTQKNPVHLYAAATLSSPTITGTTSITGSLGGLLYVQASDHNYTTDPQTRLADQPDPSLAVDPSKPVSSDNPLGTVGTGVAADVQMYLTNGKPHFVVDGHAQIDLDLSAGLGPPPAPGQKSSLPLDIGIHTEFKTGWNYTRDVLADSSQAAGGVSQLNLAGASTIDDSIVSSAGSSDFAFGSLSELSFNDVKVDVSLGGLSFLEPILDKIHAVTRLPAVHQFLAIANTNIPLVNKSIVDLVAPDLPGGVDTATAIQVLKALDDIDFKDGRIDYSLALPDLRLADNTHQITANLAKTFSSFGFDISAALPTLNKVFDTVNSSISGALDTLKTGLLSSAVNQATASGDIGSFLGSSLLGAGDGFQAPFLQHEGEDVLRLMLGQNVDLFTFKMPPLHLHLAGTLGLDILGLVKAGLSGSVDFDLNFRAGYDTKGLTDYISDPTNPVKLLDGFYIDTGIDKNLDDGFGGTYDRPHSGFSARGHIGLSVAVGVTAEGGIDGNVLLGINSSPHEPGKLRFTDLPDDLLVATGSLSAEASVSVSADIPLLSKPVTLFHYTLARTVLLSFDTTVGNTRNPPDPNAIYLDPSQFPTYGGNSDNIVRVHPYYDRDAGNYGENGLTYGTITNVSGFPADLQTGDHVYESGIEVDYGSGTVERYPELAIDSGDGKRFIVGSYDTIAMISPTRGLPGEDPLVIPDNGFAVSVENAFDVFKDYSRYGTFGVSFAEPDDTANKPHVVLLVGGAGDDRLEFSDAEGIGQATLVGGGGNNRLVGGTLEFGYRPVTIPGETGQADPVLRQIDQFTGGFGDDYYVAVANGQRKPFDGPTTGVRMARLMLDAEAGNVGGSNPGTDDLVGTRGADDLVGGPVSNSIDGVTGADLDTVDPNDVFDTVYPFNSLRGSNSFTLNVGQYGATNTKIFDPQSVGDSLIVYHSNITEVPNDGLFSLGGLTPPDPQYLTITAGTQTDTTFTRGTDGHLNVQTNSRTNGIGGNSGDNSRPTDGNPVIGTGGNPADGNLGGVGGSAPTGSAPVVTGLAGSDTQAYSDALSAFENPDSLTQSIVNQAKLAAFFVTNPRSLVINGTNFDPTTSVGIGQVGVNFLVLSDTQILAALPSEPGGTEVDVTVTNPSGTSTKTLANRYVYPAATVAVIDGQGRTVAEAFGVVNVTVAEDPNLHDAMNVTIDADALYRTFLQKVNVELHHGEQLWQQQSTPQVNTVQIDSASGQPVTALSTVAYTYFPDGTRSDHNQVQITSGNDLQVIVDNPTSAANVANYLDTIGAGPLNPDGTPAPRPAVGSDEDTLVFDGGDQPVDYDLTIGAEAGFVTDFRNSGVSTRRGSLTVHAGTLNVVAPAGWNSRTDPLGGFFTDTPVNLTVDDGSLTFQQAHTLSGTVGGVPVEFVDPRVIKILDEGVFSRTVYTPDVTNSNITVTSNARPLSITGDAATDIDLEATSYTFDFDSKGGVGTVGIGRTSHSAQSARGSVTLSGQIALTIDDSADTVARQISVNSDGITGLVQDPPEPAVPASLNLPRQDGTHSSVTLITSPGSTVTVNQTGAGSRYTTLADAGGSATIIQLSASDSVEVVGLDTLTTSLYVPNPGYVSGFVVASEHAALVFETPGGEAAGAAATDSVVFGKPIFGTIHGGRFYYPVSGMLAGGGTVYYEQGVPVFLIAPAISVRTITYTINAVAANGYFNLDAANGNVVVNASSAAEGQFWISDEGGKVTVTNPSAIAHSFAIHADSSSPTAIDVDFPASTLAATLDKSHDIAGAYNLTWALPAPKPGGGPSVVALPPLIQFIGNYALDLKDNTGNANTITVNDTPGTPPASSGGPGANNVPQAGAVVDTTSTDTTITVTVGAPAMFQAGELVSVSGVQGNTAANGTHVIIGFTPTSFTFAATGGTAYTSGGQWVTRPTITVPTGPTSTSTVQIDTRAGAVAVVVTSNALTVDSGGSIALGTGTVQQLLGAVRLGSYVVLLSDTRPQYLAPDVTINDSADTTARNVTLANTLTGIESRADTVTGLAPALISYDSNLSFSPQGKLAALTILGGTGGGTWTVNNTGPQPTVLKPRSASVQVNGTGGTLLIDGGGSINVTVPDGGSALAGTVAVQPSDHSDDPRPTLTIGAAGSTASNTIALAPSGIRIDATAPPAIRVAESGVYEQIAGLGAAPIDFLPAAVKLVSVTVAGSGHGFTLSDSAPVTPTPNNPHPFDPIPHLAGLPLSLTDLSGGGSLGGPNLDNVWNITGPGSGTLNGTVRFTGMSNGLRGGTRDDAFRFGVGAAQGFGTIGAPIPVVGFVPAVDGGLGGKNTLDFSRSPDVAHVSMENEFIRFGVAGPEGVDGQFTTTHTAYTQITKAGTFHHITAFVGNAGSTFDTGPTGFGRQGIDDPYLPKPKQALAGTVMVSGFAHGDLHLLGSLAGSFLAPDLNLGTVQIDGGLAAGSVLKANTIAALTVGTAAAPSHSDALAGAVKVVGSGVAAGGFALGPTTVFGNVASTASITAPTIDRIHISSNLAGVIDETSPTDDLQSLTVDGSITSTALIRVAVLGSLTVGGDMAGTLIVFGAVTPDGAPLLGAVVIGGGLTATGTLTAGSIGEVTIGGVSYSIFSQLGSITILAPDGRSLSVRTTPAPGGVETGPSDLRYVLALYQNLLERAITLAELQGGATNGWLATMHQHGQSAVVAAFEQTFEYRTVQVRHQYQRYFHRDADGVGLANWATFLQSHSVEDLALQLILSPEYAATHGTAEQIVEAIYRDALDRGLEPTSLAGYTTLLNTPSGVEYAAIDQYGRRRDIAALETAPKLARIAWGVLTSAEYRTDQVSGHYADYLARPAAAVEANGWLGLYSAGGDGIVIAAMLGIPDGEFARDIG